MVMQWCNGQKSEIEQLEKEIEQFKLMVIEYKSEVVMENGGSHIAGREFKFIICYLVH